MAPLAAPSAMAMAKKAMVPSGASGGVNDWTAAPATTTASEAASTRTGPIRSDSQPPTGRMATASSTKPAMRLAASSCVRP